MSINADAIARDILGQARKIGGETWKKIEKSAPFYVNGYAQVVTATAREVAAGGLSKSDGRMIVSNAKLLLSQGIANTSLIILSQVQKFINAVIGILKTQINAALPFPIL
jgi:hypothetical protein